jgi:diguanylate cyclase (GGDEF)-like protein/PAS domain S-box-containing protein
VAKGEEIEPAFAGDVEAWVAERIRRREQDAGQAPRVYRIGDGRWMLTGISRTRAGGIVAVRTDITRLREIENSLKAALDEQELIFEGATTGIAFIKQRTIVRCNRRFAEMFGYAREELIGQSTQILYGSSEDWQQVGREGYPRIERGETYQSEVQGRRRSGEAFWMQVTGRLVQPADPAKGSIWVINDVDDRRRTEDALKAALIEEQRIMDTATVGIVFLKERRVVKCNRHFAAMFAYAPEELTGHSSAIWYPSVETWQKMGGEAYAAVERGEPYEFEHEFVKKNGERFWCHVAGSILDATDPARGSIWVYTDVTERKTREEEIRELAHHDALTGLPNRRLLDDRMTQAFASARRSSEHVALMLLDLDRFKPVNDNHGHEAGDAVLKVVGARLKGCVREADTVARIGGDEFVVMILVHAPNDAVRVAEKILGSLAQPIPVAGNEFRIGASIGISLYPEDATEQDTLLNCADRAMYYVKAAGRNAYRFYAWEQAPPQV